MSTYAPLAAEDIPFLFSNAGSASIVSSRRKTFSLRTAFPNGRRVPLELGLVLSLFAHEVVPLLSHPAPARDRGEFPLFLLAAGRVLQPGRNFSLTLFTSPARLERRPFPLPHATCSLPARGRLMPPAAGAVFYPIVTLSPPLRSGSRSPFFMARSLSCGDARRLPLPGNRRGCFPRKSALEARS